MRAELLADAAKREAAEKELKARKKVVGRTLKATLDKAQARHGISAPRPGPEPKLEEVIVAEIERERLFDIIRELVKWENSNDERVLNAARAEIMRSCNGKPPPVYDPFCGGGSIPLEAQRLGLEAHASDLNPVPVLITKALIEIPPKFAGKPPVNPEAKKKLSASGSWKGAAGLGRRHSLLRPMDARRSGETHRPSLSQGKTAEGTWRRRSDGNCVAVGAHGCESQPGGKRRACAAGSFVLALHKSGEKGMG